MKPENLDVLKEIGNIGAGNAVTALATMLNREIDMSVPDVEVLSFNEITNILNGPESLVAGMLVDMTGELTGYILLILDIQDAYELVSLALNDHDRKTPENVAGKDFGEMDMSVLTELANILVGSYLSSISTLTGLNVVPSVPQIAMDMLGAIISIAVIEYGQIGDSVLCLKTKFSDIDKELSGHFFLIPDYESYKILMKSLGMEP
jgi:chemotaxis protein CheC